MTFGRSKTASKILIRCPIAFDEISNLCDSFDFVENLWNQTQTQKVLISSEAMGHRMRTLDTVLERPKVILLVFETHINILVMLGNIWSTSVDSLLTKISRNISTTDTFEGVEFFGMSSYEKYFFGI